MKKTQSKALRVVIIGAGPAGLGAAEALRELGYTNITILEKQNRVGGQSLSLNFKTPDNRDIIYEMGSLQPISSTYLHCLLKRYNLHLGKNNEKNNNKDKVFYMKLYSFKDKKVIIDFQRYFFGLPIIKALFFVPDYIKLLIALFKYKSLRKPGFILSEKEWSELSIPYEEWIDKQNFSKLNTLLKMLGMSGTMGNPELKKELPAYLFIKFIWQCLKWPSTRLRYLNGKFKFVKEGYQELWNRVAKQHNIILSTKIHSITRNQNEIVVDLGTSQLYFDKIIISCPFSQASHFLDLTEEEKYLFNKVRYNSGWGIAFLAKNLPHDAVYFFLEPFIYGTFGHISGFFAHGEVGDGVWLYTTGISEHQPKSIEHYLEEAKETLKNEFHGEVIQWVKKVYWREYIPHFSADDLKSKIYVTLESLQGKKNTYYIHETLSGSTHATVVDYAYLQIKKYFGG